MTADQLPDKSDVTLVECVKLHFSGVDDITFQTFGDRVFVNLRDVGTIAEIHDDFVEFSPLHLLAANPKFFDNVDKHIGLFRTILPKAARNISR